MLCERCANESKVIDSRETLDRGVRRRRECLGCRFRWTTYERVASSANRPIGLSNARVAKAIAACESMLKHLNALLEEEGSLDELGNDFAA